MSHSLARRRWRRFRQNKRALFSLIIFLSLFMIALFAPIIANDKPMYISYKGMPYFPLSEFVSDKNLGGDLPTAVDWKDADTIHRIQLHADSIYPWIQWSPHTIDYEVKQRGYNKLIQPQVSGAITSRV